nr:replication protein contains methyltransferase and helicase1 domains [Hibiscus latent Hawaii virus]
MTDINQQITNVRDDAANGAASLIKGLATRRVYDEAVGTLKLLDKRPKFSFTNTVSTDQAKLVTENYPEFNVSFVGSRNSVHSLAGGLRKLEMEYLMTLVPYGSPTFDIGGNYTQHLLKGRSYVHCCNPCLDFRDIARNENYKESLDSYLRRFTTPDCGWLSAAYRKIAARPLPSFQLEAMERYRQNPTDVTCSLPFQQCKMQSPDGQDCHAISVHSLYDIPVEELGAALLRKKVKTLFAALHFSEELLMGATEASLGFIGAKFYRSGDEVTFGFEGESTLLYTHSFKNICAYITRSFFVADSKYAYMKEFMVKRIDTVFCKFVRIDTQCLYKSVYHCTNDAENFIKGMDDAFAVRQRAAMLNAARPLFKDKAAFSVWFPNSVGKVIIPVFRGSTVSCSKVKLDKLLVDEDFVFTILNHIRTYTGKQLTYENVLSFVESIRSRVVINGANVRSEWDVKKKDIQDIAMSLFLITKLRTVQDNHILKNFDIKSKSFFDCVKETITSVAGSCFTPLAQVCIDNNWFKLKEDALVIEIPELSQTFMSFMQKEFSESRAIESLDLWDYLDQSSQLYTHVSKLMEKYTLPDFDVEKFKDLCATLKVGPDVIATVIEALMDKSLGFTVVGGRDDKTRSAELTAAVAVSKDYGKGYHEEAFEQKPLASAAALNNTPMCSLKKEWVKKRVADMPLQATTQKVQRFFLTDEEEGVDMDDLHLMRTSKLKEKKTQKTCMLYTGTVREQQMKNFLDYLSASICATISNLEKVLNDYWVTGSQTYQTFGLWSCKKKKWILTPPSAGHSWGVASINSEHFIVMLNFDENGQPICDPQWDLICVSNDTKLFSCMRILENLLPLPIKESVATVTLVDGVPGCGKTAEILKKANFKRDLILTQGKQAAQMIRRRANSADVTKPANTDNVRTVDSFLMNPKPFTYDTLWIDEGLMLHTGMVNYCILLSHCTKCMIYGDTQQIPFINRVMNFDYPQVLRTVVVDSVEKRRVTSRCPLDITYYLSNRYGGPVMSKSDITRSADIKFVAGAARFEPQLTPLSGKIITFTQADKETLKKKGYCDVQTVHEVQGETYNEVSLVRVTPTPLSIVSPDSSHVLVGLSRHTNRLTYYTVIHDCITHTITELGKVSEYIFDMYSVEGQHS